MFEEGWYERKQKGFASKAEFFRFAAIHLVDIIDKPIVNEEERFAFLSNALTKEIAGKYRGKKMPSVRKQLADV